MRHVAGGWTYTRPWRGSTDEWLTPPELVRALGDFDLDPASPVERLWPTARRHYTQRDDGLRRPWRGRVWLNPPYGKAIVAWMAKMAQHGDGIALTFARTDTTWFHEHVFGRAHALLFLRSRVRFLTGDGRRSTSTAGGSSVLIAYGSANARVLAEGGDPRMAERLEGSYVPLRATPPAGRAR